jgi:two-component system, OmpR family, sensor kinase
VENVTIETAGERAERAQPAPPYIEESPDAEERQDSRLRDWLGTGRSARSRILIAYVLLLALAALFAMLAFRQFLLIRLEDEVAEDLRQEVRELDLLLTHGRDPATGRPFASLEGLFDIYFARNVPSRDEAFLGFVEGKLYRSSTLAGFPLNRLPGESLEEWEKLASRWPRGGSSASGKVDTELGEAFLLSARIRYRDDVGAFVVTILPAEDREDIGTFLKYGGAASLGVLLIASAFAWLISGRVLEPVRRLTDTARSISQSDLTQRIEIRGTGEPADMARSFNAMLDRLEAVFRSQREFIQDANHELRDPLTIVRGHLQLMGDDPVERQRTIELVFDELDRMGTIVDDLKLLADVEQPGFLRLQRIELEAFTQELISKGSALASRRWVVDNVGDGTFFGDRHRLTQAVMNLAHNAVQHTADSDTIAIGTYGSEDEVRISVRDTGSGISVADQAVIFGRFTRGAGAHLRYPGGGLGLAIVKAVAEAHGGRVELQSIVGEGSTFTVVVPRYASESVAGV